MVATTQSIFHQRWREAQKVFESPEDLELSDGSMVVNGVELSPVVLNELRRLGIALESYNAGELRDAVQACIIDRKLVDDPDGLNFRDRTKLSDDEREEFEDCEYSRNPFHLHPWGFSKRMKTRAHDDDSHAFHYA